MCVCVCDSDEEKDIHTYCLNLFCIEEKRAHHRTTAVHMLIKSQPMPLSRGTAASTAASAVRPTTAVASLEQLLIK